MRKAQSADPVKIAEAVRGAHWDGLYGPEAFGMKSVYGIDYHDHPGDSRWP